MQFLLFLLLKVTLVALIGRLAIAAMPRASASTRYLMAVTTLCSMLLIPVIGASGFEWRLSVLPARGSVGRGAGPRGAREGRVARQPNG
ncbi:MAG: hypothetical protein M3041_13835 [Acidobacteriota bacterium]|nr:hypothetical protein [Acidobacteriota bacterium]